MEYISQVDELPDVLKLRNSDSRKTWAMTKVAVVCRSPGNLATIYLYALQKSTALQYIQRDAGVELPVTVPLVRCALNMCVSVSVYVCRRGGGIGATMGV